MALRVGTRNDEQKVVSTNLEEFSAEEIDKKNDQIP